MSRIETLRQNVIDAELKLDIQASKLRIVRDWVAQIEQSAKLDFDLAHDLWMTAQRELSEATRGTEVAL